MMKIEYLGHACFRIDDVLVIDPYKDGAVPGLSALRTSGARVICTHGHADHSGVECVEVDGSRECELKVEEVPSFHDDQQGALRGPNTIFVITSGAGEKLVHLGDLGHFPNDEQLAAISDADYLLTPVGGHFAIDAATALRICEASQPKCIIPMHYTTAEYGYPEIATVDEFLRLCEEAGISDKVKVMEKGEVLE